MAQKVLIIVMNYQAKVKCTNCGFEDELSIPNGMRVSEMPCPQCQTKSLIRVSTPENAKKEEASA